MTNPTDLPTKVPYAAQVALAYANLHPTPKSWRRQMLRPVNRANVTWYSEGELRDDEPLFGVQSYDELQALLANYQAVVERVVQTQRYDSPDADELWKLILQRARLIVVDWHKDPKTGRVFAEFSTRGETFEEVLYSYLQLALVDTDAAAIRKCHECEQFFYNPSRHAVLYCTDRCKKRIMMRRYRKRKRNDADESKNKGSAND